MQSTGLTLARRLAALAVLMVLGALPLVAQTLPDTNALRDTLVSLDSAAKRQVASVDNARTCTLRTEVDLYRTLLNQQFSALVGSAPGLPGSFGALDIDKENKATLAASSQPGNGVVFTLEASGTVGDGVLGLFGDTDVIPGFEVKGRIDFMPKSQSFRLIYDNPSCRAYREAYDEAQNAYVIDTVKIFGTRQLELQRRVDVARARFVQDSLQKLMNSVRAHLTNADSLVRFDKLRADSVIASEQGRQAERRVFARDSTQLLDARRKRALAIRAARTKLAITGFELHWWSFEATAASSKFTLFDSTAAFASQLTDTSNAILGGSVRWSSYSLSRGSGEARYHSWALHVARDDNMGSLKKAELTDERQHGPTPDLRVSTKKRTGLVGAYKNNLMSAKATGDYYDFLFRGNQAAVHLFPEVHVEKGSAPAYMLGFGFLVAARKEEGEKSPFNVELFYKLTDLTDSQDPEAKLDWLERGTLGLRMSFPITFSPR
jgi:hypothetical protein